MKYAWHWFLIEENFMCGVCLLVHTDLDLCAIEHLSSVLCHSNVHDCKTYKKIF